METPRIADKDATHFPVDHVRSEIRNETAIGDGMEDSVWRKFLSLYDSLQWHMYL